MKHRLTIPVMLAALALGSAAACGGNPEPQGPTPEEIEAMRQDSIRRAEQARQDSIRRAQEAEEARRRAEEAERQRQLQAETAAARAILEEMIHFDYDRSAIRPDAEQRLMRKLSVLRANPGIRTLDLTGDGQPDIIARTRTATARPKPRSATRERGRGSSAVSSR